MGRRLAAEAPADADLVIPVPDTGHAAAQGYAEVAKIPYGEGLMKNRYVGRTFIQPSQSLRERGRETQAQRDARRRSGQAARRGRRFDRSRNHHTADRAGVARGGRDRDPHADHLPADQVAVLLRDRLLGAPGARRLGSSTSTRSARSSARTQLLFGLPLVGGDGRIRRRHQGGLLPRVLRRRVPDPDFPEGAGKFLLRGPALPAGRPRAGQTCPPSEAPTTWCAGCSGAGRERRVREGRCRPRGGLQGRCS